MSGWATKFYDLSNGTFQNTTRQTQSNPVSFFLAGAITSQIGDTDYDGTEPGDFVDAGSDRIAFILQCTSGVYDMNYILSDGNVTDFATTLSNSSTAAIVNAPFQLGFGAYNLYQRAPAAVDFSENFLDNINLALSEVILAGSFGPAFTYGPNIAQRFRWNQTVTKISKPALLCFITVCFVYSALGHGLMIAAFILHTQQGVREKQAALLPDAEPLGLKRPNLLELASHGSDWYETLEILSS